MKPLIWIVGIILRVVSTIADTDEDQFSNEDGVFQYNVKNQNYFATEDQLSKRDGVVQFTIPKGGPNTEPTTKKKDPDLLYRLAITGVIELFDSQRVQINLTIVHINNVWGAEDQAVKEITAKLNSITTFVELRTNTLKAKMKRDISPLERSDMPLTWKTLDVIGRSWKEVERFIDKKIEEKPLTKAEEEELHELRQWLKFSDQELLIPFDAMKDTMEKVWTAEAPREFSMMPTTSTVIRPFSVHY